MRNQSAKNSTFKAGGARQGSQFEIRMFDPPKAVSSKRELGKASGRPPPHEGDKQLVVYISNYTAEFFLLLILLQIVLRQDKVIARVDDSIPVIVCSSGFKPDIVHERDIQRVDNAVVVQIPGF